MHTFLHVIITIHLTCKSGQNGDRKRERVNTGKRTDLHFKEQTRCKSGDGWRETKTMLRNPTLLKWILELWNTVRWTKCAEKIFSPSTASGQYLWFRLVGLIMFGWETEYAYRLFSLLWRKKAWWCGLTLWARIKSFILSDPAAHVKALKCCPERLTKRR